MVPALGIALAGVLLLIVFWRRHIGSLAQVASLLAGLLLLIWLQDNGYLGGNPHPPFADGRSSPTPGSR